MLRLEKSNLFSCLNGVYKNKNIDYYSQHDVHKNKPIFGFDYLGEIREYKDFSNRYLESAGNISKGHYNPVELSMGVPITAFMMKKERKLIMLTFMLVTAGVVAFAIMATVGLNIGMKLYK